ncbi:MAG: CinA family nicotinamide mononucleotide deamidase-related protein, partial [Bdellovibrionales bacterium]|nr:CinA family nicotinamide mononucleotide deamidase-related protein [Bdellovibrionales bacterium]
SVGNCIQTNRTFMRQSLAILAIGDELLDGRLRDGNAHFIGQQATELGLTCSAILSCGDDEQAIIESLEYLAKKAQLIIVSGGLGPTTDDKTRASIAGFCGEALLRNDEVLEALKLRYAERGRTFDSSNEQQAYFPEKAQVLENPYGTAAAFLSVKGPTSIIALPGVPSELKGLWKLHCEDYIRAQFQIQVRESRYFCVFGYPESKLNSIITALDLAPSIVVSYRASFPFIQLVFKSDNRSELEIGVALVEETIGSDYIVSKDPACSLVEIVVELVRARSFKLGLAESCTGGLIASELTALAGVSDIFSGGVVSYSNAVKHGVLGVAEETLATKGAVSHETALEMVRGIVQTLGVDCALSVTGIAGPDGGSAEKPVGLFFVGCATPSGTKTYKFQFTAERDKVQGFAAMMALDVLRRTLLGLDVPSIE